MVGPVADDRPDPLRRGQTDVMRIDLFRYEESRGNFLEVHFNNLFGCSLEAKGIRR